MNIGNSNFYLQSGTGDADANGLLVQPLAADAQLVVAGANPLPGPEIVFIEGDVPELSLLQEGMGAGREVYVLDPGQDGLVQMATILAGRSGISALHLVTHGAAGTIDLGTTTLDAGTLAQHQAQLQAIGNSLSAGGDILLYGCDLGAGQQGHAFLDQLAAATGADVAASNDLTGSANLGGDWSLEVRSGDVEAAPAVSAQLAAHYMEVLSLTSVTVNFGTAANFVSYGDYYAGAASDVTYKVSNNSNYVLKINGAASAAYDYKGTSGYVTVGSAIGETLITVNFAGGNLFSISSLDFTNFDGTNSQTEVFRGYDASNTLIATTSASTAANGTSAVSFSGFTNIATLKISATTNGGAFYTTGVALDNLAFSTITAAPPTVTDARIAISGASGTGGAYKIGDTVTATWNNTAAGDNNTGVTAVTMNFSQFGGGSAVSAIDSSGTWTATYTILAGSIDATNRNVSVTADTGATTTTADSTNATVDNIAPTVADSHISISGASGTGGAYKIGDTVTATWNNTAGGDNNSDTISGATVNFSQFGGGSAVAATNSSGTWTATYTILAGAIDGTSKNVSVTATDNAGNTTTTADTTNATVDSIAPTVADAHISISGASGAGGAYRIGDIVTATWDNTAGGDNNSDTISAATVNFSQFGGGSAVAATNSSGTWTATYTIVSGSIDGVINRNVSVTATDNAGNATTAADSTNATVDNVAPAITFSSLAFSADTGSSSTDFVTKTAAQTITATLSGAPAGGDIVYGTLDNGSSWTDITSKVSGTTLTWDGVTLTASDTLKLKVTDSTGNDGTVKSQAFVLDTSVPAAPSVPDMTSGTDTGSSSTDNITSNTTATFTGTAESGATVALYDTDGTTQLGTATATGGNWSITSSALGEGAHTLTAKATDAAGNTGSASSGLSITIDTTTPAAPGTPDLAPASDSGTSSSDNVTKVTTPTITGTAESGATVTLYDTDGTTVLGTGTATGGNWSITTSVLSQTTHTLTAKATDAAGNAGAASSGLSFTVDTTAPTTTISTMGFSADTGSSSTDFITKTAAQTISGTTSANIASGEIVEVSTDNGASWTTATSSVGANTWSLSGVTLAGSNTLKVRVSDTAGNAGTVASQAYVLDTTAPGAPSTPDMTSGTDTGASSGDNVTSNTTPTLTGTAESGSTVTLYDTNGTTQLGTATATGGNWSITSSALSEGSHTLTATATDAAGNVSAASSGLGATIDTTAPSVASVAVPADGTYAIGQSLQFTVNMNEAVTVDTSGGTPRIALTVGASTDYATYASGSGTSALVFSYTVQSGDTDSNGITVGALQANGGTMRDTAGNDASVTLNSIGSTANVNIDGVAPTVSSVTVPADGSYGAGVGLDFTVNFSEAVTVGGTPHIAITLDTGGTVYADYLSGSGTSALVFRYTIASGVDDATGVTVGALSVNGGTVRDVAGNDATLTLNGVASTAAVLVDTTAPTVTFSSLAFSSDTGASSTDFITSTAAQTISATLSGSPGADSVWGSLDGGGSWTDISSMVSGTTLTWTGVTLTGSGTLQLKVRDAAGNDGTVASQAYVLDSVAPSAPSAPDMTAGSDTGSSSSDNVTSTTTPTFTGTAEANSTVTLYDTDGTTVLGTATATGGNWSIASSALSEGAHTLTAKAADTAGNVSSASSSLDATIDSTAPAAPSAPDLAASSDDGASNTDNATSITTPTFTGTAESGSLVTLYDTDGTTVLGTATATGGTWSIASSALALGLHTIYVNATDAAGNVGSLSTGLDTTIQVPGTTPPSGRGGDLLTGTAGDDVLDGGRGADTMIGGLGNDTYYVDRRSDVITELPGQGTDTVFASRSFTLPANVENLTLVNVSAAHSAAGNDLGNVLTGNDFTNVLTGLLGADTLTGGLASDLFTYVSAADSPATPGAWDVITDFSSAERDRIDLSRVDANAATPGSQHFTYIGSAAFSADATAQLRFDSGTHMLYGSTNADSTPEFAIELTGVTVLAASDLRL
jgi:large repetitive protein